MSNLLDRMMKSGSIESTLLMDSEIFTEKDCITTDIPILNIAFSGNTKGGFIPGLTILAGESKTFKSALALYCLKAYLDKYKDGIGILYDNEFGMTPKFISSFGVDPARVIHIPIEHVEQLKFDFIKKLNEIKKGDHVFFMVDSIGQMSSKKEVEDAESEKSATDMTRAKAIRSLLRLVTIQLNVKKIPCFMVNHVYEEMGMFPKVVIPGGKAVTYSSNQIFVITKSQEKASSGELEGWTFTIHINKSRFVREKSKFAFTAFYESGIQQFSGMLELATELGVVVKPSKGWYSRMNLDTGEIEEAKFRASEAEKAEFWAPLLNHEKFNEAIAQKYLLGNGVMGDFKIS